MPVDIKLFYLLNSLAGKSAVSDFIFIFLADYLQYFLVAFFLLILFFSAYSSIAVDHPNGEKKEKIEVFLVAAVSAIVARFGIVTLIRFFYHRPRPFLVLPVHQLITDNEYSFPSGHAAFFFAMAMAVYFYNKKSGVWFFVFAALITVARIIAGVHYPTDILSGAAIGILTASAIFYLAKKWEKS